MDVKRQQDSGDQRYLFEELAPLRPGAEGGTGPAACEASQATTALGSARALTEHLMEKVCRRENLNRSYRRVQANTGAPGADGMVHECGLTCAVRGPVV